MQDIFSCAKCVHYFGIYEQSEDDLIKHYEPVCGRYIDHNRKEKSWRLREVISGGANLNKNQARDNFDPR